MTAKALDKRMKDPQPQLQPEFSPEWDFLNDSKLRQLNQVLDECYSGIDPETQSGRDLAREKFMTLWPEIFSEYSKTKSKRALLIKFLRKNIRILDAGGVWKGNDPQVSALREANDDLIKNHGIEYWKVVEEIEK